MINEEILIKRLSLIKYLYKIGIEQANQFETLAGFSILSFHDSIEMFLKLVSEHKNIKSEKLNFIEYWSKIPDLTLIESMRNLNTRRVNIKHKGIFPSKSDIDICKINTTEFFEENTKKQFNIVFDEISLSSLISYENVRNQIVKAENELSQNSLKNSLEFSAIAFYELIKTYEDSKSNFFQNSPFLVGQKFKSRKSRFNSDDSALNRFVEEVEKNISGIQEDFKILSLGIDFKKYTKFKFLTPDVSYYTSKLEYSPIFYKKTILNKGNCEYCINFVIDSSLKLLEFDYDITELIDN